MMRYPGAQAASGGIAMAAIRTVEELERIYGPLGAVGESSTAKVADHVTPQYRRFIEAAPFLALATSGPEGLDCSPRGDRPGFVRIQDPRTLLLPDRRGNNRIDSLRNVVRDPRVGLMFLIPGVGNAMRVNGHAHLDTDPALLESFAVEGKAPRTVMVVAVREVYFQCARALIRSRLWDPASHVDPKTLPTPGQILAEMSAGRTGGDEYDRTWADRARRRHAMRHLLQQVDETARIQLLSDYFTLPLEAFCQRHLPNPEAAGSPQIPEYRERILGGLSEAQLRVVQDDESRALLVLAGPGSGKTRTIVHRVANLVALRDVNPERVLVLAYNRTAVAEVRERLSALIGGSGMHVDVLTFHGLARRLTNLSERDAPRELSAEDRFTWLIEQAVAHLRENPAPYQYVLVDEYQDIKGAEYDLVTLLASFDRGTGGPQATAADEDDREQPGYLVAVGDDDQNLYTFQGANIEFIHRFRRDYDIPEEKVVALLPNYRSRPGSLRPPTPSSSSPCLQRRGSRARRSEW